MKKEITGLDGILAFPAFPVVLVTTQTNIITVAAMHMFSFNPPIVSVGICPPRYTYKLIKEEKEFGINVPTKDMIDVVEFCGTKSGAEVDKFEEFGLTPMKAKQIKSKLIAECPVNLECKVLKELDLQGSHVWFIGAVEAAHIDENYDKTKALMYWAKEYRTIGEILHKR